MFVISVFSSSDHIGRLLKSEALDVIDAAEIELQSIPGWRPSGE